MSQWWSFTKVSNTLILHLGIISVKKEKKRRNITSRLVFLYIFVSISSNIKFPTRYFLFNWYPRVTSDFPSVYAIRSYHKLEIPPHNAAQFTHIRRLFIALNVFCQRTWQPMKGYYVMADLMIPMALWVLMHAKGGCVLLLLPSPSPSYIRRIWPESATDVTFHLPRQCTCSRDTGRRSLTPSAGTYTYVRYVYRHRNNPVSLGCRPSLCVFLQRVRFSPLVAIFSLFLFSFRL